MNTKLHSLFILFLFPLLSCSEEVPTTENLSFSEDKFSIILEDSLTITSDQMEMYDYSTHVIYLKEPLSFLSEFMSAGSFRVIAKGEEIYTGQLFPAWYSSIPYGPFIWIPSLYQDNVIKLDYHQNLDPSGDLRKDPRISEALKESGLYHAGLELQVDKIISEGNNIELQFTIINNDSFNFYILSPDKMGIRLFHYFTTGLRINREGQPFLSHHLDIVQPDPWDSWNILWMDLLESGDSKTYTFSYENFDLVEDGNYKIYFKYPGLSYQVSQPDLQQTSGRIWLGEINYESTWDLH